jgi:hypothetical protein
MKLRFSDEVLKLLALIIKYGKPKLPNSRSTHRKIDDERKILFGPDVISSIKSIITDNRSYERNYALGILKQALDYGMKFYIYIQ